MSFWDDLSHAMTGGTPSRDPWAYWGGQDAAMRSDPSYLAAAAINPVAEANAQPMLGALDSLATLNRPKVRADTWAVDAERGFGMSGQAVDNVSRALANFDADLASKRSDILSSAYRDVLSERQAQVDRDLQTRQLDLQKKASKKRFLGIF